MVITEQTIRAIASMYTEQELEVKIQQLIVDLESNGSTITAASTGAGASYTRRIDVSRAELLELYMAALDYKRGKPAQTGKAYHVWFQSGFNR